MVSQPNLWMPITSGKFALYCILLGYHPKKIDKFYILKVVWIKQDSRGLVDLADLELKLEVCS